VILLYKFELSFIKMSVNKKRKDLSVTEKLRLTDTYDKLNLRSLSQREEAAKLGVPLSTFSELLKSRDALIRLVENRKRKHEGKCHAVDEALLVWFKQVSSYNAPINCSILLQKANDFGEKLEEDFKVTNGWLTRWKERHDIVYKKLHGEKQDSDGSAADTWLQTDWKTVLNTYSLEDIFNTDKMGLYCKATPDYCMIFKNAQLLQERRLRTELQSINLQYDGNNQNEAISNRKEQIS
jgi:hypothetical protein